MSNPSDIAAVKVTAEGRFTEWYAPAYKEPYEDTPEYREYFDKHIAEKIPVLGASLGDAEDENVSSDLDCLLDRLADEVPSKWDDLRKRLAIGIAAALSTCTERVVEMDGSRFTLTPFAKKHMPPVNEKMLTETYGEYAALMRERIAAI